MMRLEPGTIFARDYRVVQPIACGGMGAVYRVEQLSTLKHRALKVLHTRVVGDERARSRFVREATVGARIRSAHVVEVIGAGIDESTGLPWLAMELLDGFDLGAVVGYHGRLTPHELLAAFRQLCHGLAAAHEARIVHRDLKPENVFVARSHRAGSLFTVKILDFGIAKVVRESPLATDTGAVGSPLWMAPEQINAAVLSPRTDVWALGLLAFWALTGRVYWKAAHGSRVTVQALFVEQLFSPIVDASVRAEAYGLADAIPEGFDAWFSACVQREPEHRFEDASAAFNALRNVLSEGAVDSGRAFMPPADYEPAAVTTRDDRDAAGGALGATTIEGTTGDLMGTGVPTLMGTQASGQVRVSAGVAPGVTTELAPGPSSTMVAPTPAKPSTAKLATLVGVSAALGGAALAVALMVGHDARSTDADETPSRPDPEADWTMTAAAAHRVDAPGDEAELELVDGPADGLEPLALEPQQPPALTRPMSGMSIVRNRKATQPSFAPADLEFLGWARDGSVFALQTAHGHEQATGDAPANYVELVEVHDASTGLLVESYLRERIADPSIPKTDRLAKLAAEAEPLREWQARGGELELLAPDPRRERLRGPGEVRVTQSEVPLQTKVRMVPKRAGVDFVWWGVKPEGSGRDRAPLGPRLRFDLVVPEARYELLDIRIPFTYDDVAHVSSGAGAPVSVEGHLRFHWSPTEDRIVLEIRGDGSEPGLHDRRWFLRASGPQIRLIDAGAGQKVARQTARRLGDAGLPIAVVDLDYDPVDRSEIYYRAHDTVGPDLASRIAATLGDGLPAKPLETGGWTAAVIVLGQDYDPGQAP